MRRVALIAILILFLSLPVAVSITGYSNVTVSAAKNMIDSNPSLVVLDVRTQSEYDSGHIRNAKHIPVGELEGRLDELETADEILVYCRSGGRSATASQILAENGFSQVFNMLGGITAWIDAGYPIYVKYSSIQEAINSADGGDTIYVSSGTYYENVVVNKSVSLIGEDKNTTIIDGDQTGTVVRVTEDNVTIKGFTIQSGEVGLDLNSNNNTVASNKFRSHGLQETDIITDLEIHQDAPASPVWRFLYDLINGSYTEFIELTTETPIIGVKASGHSDVVELLLGLFHDENEDGVPQLHEFTGFASRGHEAWAYLFDPPKGRYIIKVRGNNVTGDPGHFDREIIKFKGYGIGVHNSSNNVFSENLITENYAGLYIQSCSSVMIRMNDVTRNVGGIIGGNLTDSIFYTNKIHHNNSSDDFSIGILLRASKNIDLTNNQLSFNMFGISLWNSSYIDIIENDFYSHVGSSIGLHSSSDNNIVNNNISKVSVLDGIRLMFSSRNNLEGNGISESEHSGILLWYDCINNTVIDNNIRLSGIQGVSHGHGIEVLLSSNNVFADNVISHSRVQGIIMIEASNNNFTGNLISSNWDGIILWSCNENWIYHNNIIDNLGQQGYDDTGDNHWDNGYEGNYWSNYSGTDLDGDGIGDTYLPWEEVDNYPLMNLYWNPADINHDLKVDIYDVVLACSAYASTPSDPHWNPHCDIAEPYEIIDIYDIVMIAGSYGEEYNP
ncbi:MAG: right-handed parallel beta-helix repeat-containing protein [Candidatus Bathyarchaeota archaeon]|nr:right-handed parallel beta-helix repeat-containing protein [Candidatus Bathyarchaeota archaeon]